MALEPVLPCGFSSSPSYLTVVQVWVEIWGWVGVGGRGPSHHPPCAGLGLAGGAIPQHCPHQEMWSKPSSSSPASLWSSAVSLHELVSCTPGSEQSVSQEPERAESSVSVLDLG